MAYMRKVRAPKSCAPSCESSSSSGVSGSASPGADTAPSLMPVSPKESARDTSAAFDDIAETLDSRSAFPLSSFVWVLTAGVRRAQAAVTDSVSSTQSRKRASSFFIVMTILS